MTFDFASIVLTVGYRSAANPGEDKFGKTVFNFLLSKIKSLFASLIPCSLD